MNTNYTSGFDIEITQLDAYERWDLAASRHFPELRGDPLTSDIKQKQDRFKESLQGKKIFQGVIKSRCKNDPNKGKQFFLFSIPFNPNSPSRESQIRMAFLVEIGHQAGLLFADEVISDE